MERKGAIGWVLLAAVIFTASASLYGMMRKRFSTGTTYPALSSLRADPLGARAIYEALDQLPGIRTERNFRQLDKLQGAPGRTLFVLNVSEFAFDTREVLEGDAVTRFAADGGRVVITVDGHSGNTIGRSLERAIDNLEEERRAKKEKEEAEKESAEKVEEAPQPNAKKDAKGSGKKKRNMEPKKKPAVPEENPADEEKSDDDEDDPSKIRHRPSLAQSLKLSLNPREFRLSAKGGAELSIPPYSPLSVIPVPDWFSDTTLVPDPPDEAQAAGEPWEPLAFRSDRAMIAQRRIGTGSIVVCSDSYFMTNEALWSDPHPEFLLWLTGGAKTLIFEERHLGLGMGDDPGIMNLARRYHMHGLFIGGLVLFALFVWRNSSSLVPHDEEVDLGITKGGLVSGEGASAGLVSLLRRGVSRSALLSKCLDAWAATPAAVKRTPARRIDAAREALQTARKDSAQRKNFVGQYQTLARILHDTQPPNS